MNKLVFAASSALVLAACGSAAQAADLSILYNFTTTGTMALNRPQSGLTIDADGNLFGTTLGGSSTGTAIGGAVWKLAAGSSTLEALASFTASKGPRSCAGGLVTDAQGKLYGTTTNGGTSGFGTVFKLSNTGYGIAPAAVTPPVVVTPEVTPAAVPEPASRATMILGVGPAGGCAAAAAHGRRLRVTDAPTGP